MKNLSAILLAFFAFYSTGTSSSDSANGIVPKTWNPVELYKQFQEALGKIDSMNETIIKLESEKALLENKLDKATETLKKVVPVIREQGATIAQLEGVVSEKESELEAAREEANRLLERNQDQSEEIVKLKEKINILIPAANERLTKFLSMYQTEAR